MTAQPLIITRRLAIQLLHEAQVAAPEAIHGVVTCNASGEPSHFVAADQMGMSSVTPWAAVFSNPNAPAEPSLAELSLPLTLVISLDTKGVLQMRAWVQQNGAPFERAVAIID